MKRFVRPLLAPMVRLGALVGALAFLPNASAQSALDGAKKATMCIGCHGIPEYKASFPEVYRVPMIAGQKAQYLASALAQYKKGDRKHPTMRAIAASLSDRDIADLAAFYAGEAGSNQVPATAAGTVAPEVAQLLNKGNCASCHGANFSAPIDPSYPKLAGQHADYLFAALRAYQTDKNAQVGRNNPIMVGIARQFSHAEAQQLAAYLASLPGETKTVPQSRFR